MERRLVILIWVFAILAAPLCASETPKAVWTTHGMLINDTPGNTPQENPRVISDKSGNHIIVWEDGRSGYYDIYVQKVSGSGALLWSPGGAEQLLFGKTIEMGMPISTPKGSTPPAKPCGRPGVGQFV